MGNKFMQDLDTLQCDPLHSLTNDGLKKCYFDRAFSGCNFIIFWILFYQIYFVYHLNYNVPVFQIGMRQKYRTREHRQDILVICAISTFYTTIHYLTWHSYRAKMFSLIIILKFNVMMLITFYYLKMASEQIFQREQYLRFKWSLVATYVFFMTLMIYSMIKIYVLLDLGTSNPDGLEADQLCISWNYMSLRWGEVICSIIFLIITVFVQIKVEDEFKKRLLKVNFEQIIFRDRFSED